MMARCTRLLVLLALLAAGGAAAPAQEAVPAPDARGNYFRNEGPVLGEVPSPHLQQGALWRVVCDDLALRREPSLSGAVIRRFQAGTVLQANVGRGGSDEVLVNALDSEGNPWMWVRTEKGESLDGYVRANRRYIRPVLPSERR